MHCPFCKLHSSETVLLENDYAIAVCDARPICAGHVLVVPKTHVPSIFDLDPQTYRGLRVLLEEVAERLRSTYGESGCYEHGRSPMCRFHAADAGFLHAHVHALPLSTDIISEQKKVVCETGPPRAQTLREAKRYLYQRCGSPPVESWAPISRIVPRHFVRTALQVAMGLRGRRYLSLSADTDTHEDAIDETNSVFAKRPQSNPVRTLTRPAQQPPYGLRILDQDTALNPNGSLNPHIFAKNAQRVRQTPMPSGLSPQRDLIVSFPQVPLLISEQQQVITIDGLPGTGKSSLAASLRRIYGCDVIEVGPIFRLIAWNAFQLRTTNWTSALDSTINQIAVARVKISLQTECELASSKILFTDGTDYRLLWDQGLSRSTSHIASQPEIISEVASIVRELLRPASQVIVVGRQAGSVVMPCAALKIRLVADRQIRGLRKEEQLARVAGRRAKCLQVDSSEPLLWQVVDGDALQVDTTRLSGNQLLRIVCSLIGRRLRWQRLDAQTTVALKPWHPDRFNPSSISRLQLVQFGPATRFLSRPNSEMQYRPPQRTF